MRIALCGSAPSSVRLAPFQNPQFQQWQQGMTQFSPPPFSDQNWEIWGCSPGFWASVQGQRITRFFEVHRWEPGQPWLPPEYCRFLMDFKGPVYTGGAIPEITNHVVYPIDAIEAEFSSYFLTSSLALMCALAIQEIEEYRRNNPDHNPNDDIIGMWGVDMGAAEEYGYQRPGCQFFILEAMRRGIAIYLPPESDLMRPMPVYGISEWDHNYIKLTQRSREIGAMAQQAQQQAAEATQRMHTLAGESHMLDFFVKTWTSPYGMQHGMTIRQAPGTGLGSGITHFDGRPVTRMTLGGKTDQP